MFWKNFGFAFHNNLNRLGDDFFGFINGGKSLQFDTNFQIEPILTIFGKILKIVISLFMNRSHDSELGLKNYLQFEPIS